MTSGKLSIYHKKALVLMHKGVKTSDKHEARWGIGIEIPPFSEKEFFKKVGIEVQSPCPKYVIDDDPFPQYILRKRKEYGYVLRIEYYPESHLKIWKVQLVAQQVFDLLEFLEKKKIPYYDVFMDKYETGKI